MEVRKEGCVLPVRPGRTNSCLPSSNCTTPEACSLDASATGHWDVDPRAFGRLDAWALGRLSVRAPRRLDAWTLGRLDTWTLERSGALTLGHLDFPRLGTWMLGRCPVLLGKGFIFTPAKLRPSYLTMQRRCSLFGHVGSNFAFVGRLEALPRQQDCCLVS